MFYALQLHALQLHRHRTYNKISSAVRIFESSSRIVTSVFDSIRIEDNYSNFSNTYRHQFRTYLTEWRRFFTLATTSINKQNLLLTMVQVLYLLEVFMAHQVLLKLL